MTETASHHQEDLTPVDLYRFRAGRRLKVRRSQHELDDK